MAARKILIIDDDEELCDELAGILGDFGYVLSRALDGLSGKHLIEAGSFDAVILDLKLPHINGFELLKLVHGRDPKTKIIVVSGRPQNGNHLLKGAEQPQWQIEEKMLRTADAVFSKPFDVEKFLSVLQKLWVQDRVS